MKTCQRYLIILTVFFSFMFSTQYAFANDKKVVDEPNILTTKQEAQLNENIQDIINKYDFDLAVIIVNSTQGKGITAYADDYYDYQDYGIGNNKDGALIVMDYKNRNIAISTHGSGLKVFTDYGINYILDEIVIDFKDNSYFDGFQTYVDLSKQCLKQASTGAPYDINNEIKEPKNIFLAIVIGVIGGTVIAIIVTQTMKSKMKSIRPEKAAGQYVGKDGLVLSVSQDIYLYSTTTKTKIVRSSGSSGHSSGGGSSSHTSSSGRTHGGGSRHF